VSVSEARAVLPELVNRVGDGEEITITRHGRPVAVLVRPDLLRGRRIEEVAAGAQRINDLLTEARSRPVATVPGLSPDYADELVREIRADRDAR
jgi:antitoxin (DNA-binding transcriptional repressor) of toxin-antitoxin stability system